jgi:hypothetical protein
MRTHQQLIDEIARRKALGLPRIELTPAERIAAFGDTQWAKRDPDAHDLMLVQRLNAGLPLSNEDKRRARRYLKKI